MLPRTLLLSGGSGEAREGPSRGAEKKHTQFADSFLLLCSYHTQHCFFLGGHTAAKRGKSFFTFSFPPEEETKIMREKPTTMKRIKCGETKAQQQSMDSSTNQSLNLHTLVECSHISTWLDSTVSHFFFGVLHREKQKTQEKKWGKSFSFLFVSTHSREGAGGGGKRKFFTLLLLLLREPLFPSSYFH